jgi:hypothetical protein
MRLGKTYQNVGILNSPLHSVISNSTDAIAQVPLETAMKLANRTWPAFMSGDHPDYYTISPDVFHALHCLVRILLMCHFAPP